MIKADDEMSFNKIFQSLAELETSWILNLNKKERDPHKKATEHPIRGIAKVKRVKYFGVTQDVDAKTNAALAKCSITKYLGYLKGKLSYASLTIKENLKLMQA
jgi:hypothetical protein